MDIFPSDSGDSILYDITSLGNRSVGLRLCPTKFFEILRANVPGWSRKRYPCFNFAITSENVHRFSQFHC